MRRTIKKLSILFIAICSGFVTVSAISNDRRVSYEKLPKDIKTFITTHFPNEKMAYAEKDWDGYDVVLTNGADLEFTSRGRWTEIQIRQGQIPESILKLLPEALINYTKQTYPGKSIKEIVSKSYGYEIELQGMHDLELKFDKNGKFLYIDD